MAFYINDSANTSHPLMDAIVKYSKIILDDMVLKNEEVANNYETESSMIWSDYLIAVKNGSMRLGFFPATSLYDYLEEYGYSPEVAFDLSEDPSLIPSEEYDKILEFCNKRFLEDYEEENLYYRRLNGLPPYDTTDFDIYIDYETYGSYLDLDDAYTDFDFSKPIHEYSVTEITTLETLGILDILYEKYITNNEDRESREGYKYLRFLGGRKIDVYEARIANNWDILYMPPADIYVVKRFRELYAVNRAVYERSINQLAYSVRSDHFQEMVMFMVVCQTFNDMIVDTPEWYIRRDIIDLRSVEYFLTSQGVKFFEDIPMRYQIRIVKNLNRLIRFKSTDKNIMDILEIFANEDAKVYQYYLLKKYKTTNLNQHTITGLPPLPEVWHLEDEYDYGYIEDPVDGEDTIEDGGDEDEGQGNLTPELVHDPSADYDDYGNAIYDFQDFDDPAYIVDNEVLFMFDFETEETPNILPWTTLPYNEDGNQELDAWYEDSEHGHEGDEDHSEILNNTGDGEGNDESWLNAGCIDIPDGPVMKENKFFDRICFGYDKDNLYLRFYVNNYIFDSPAKKDWIYQMYVYTRCASKKHSLSPVRLINKTEDVLPVTKQKFHNEIQLSIFHGKLNFVRLIKSIPNNLWVLQSSKNIKYVFNKVIDLQIPFDDLDIGYGENMEFVFVNALVGLNDIFIPNEMLLNIIRD